MFRLNQSASALSESRGRMLTSLPSVSTAKRVLLCRLLGECGASLSPALPVTSTLRFESKVLVAGRLRFKL